jgi:hypothetical protein
MLKVLLILSCILPIILSYNFDDILGVMSIDLNKTYQNKQTGTYIKLLKADKFEFVYFQYVSMINFEVYFEVKTIEKTYQDKFDAVVITY